MAAAPVIHSVQLKGHQAAISCLDHSSRCASSVGPSLLLSGSEDGTCRLWDLRIGRSVSCIKCSGSNGGEVLSVAFGPAWKTSDATTEEAKSPFSHDFSVYASVENSVYGYDLRKASSPIVIEPSIDLSGLLEAPDDVNQIAFSPVRDSATTPTSSKKGNRKKAQSSQTPIHLAAVDDGGTVRVTADWALNTISSERSGNKRVFCHGTDAMVTSLSFAPKNSTNKHYLASGGTDCCINIYDIAMLQQTKPVVSISISNTEAGANQVCNPPFVHSLEYSPSGRLLAAGLGDGSIALVQGQVVTARLEDAHTGSVASCLFPAWRNDSSAITAHDRLLCSIGNDGCIVMWDLGATISGEKATNPSDLLQIMSVEALEEEKMQNMSLQDKEEFDQPKTLFAFQHAAGKPNWMVSGRAHDPIFPSSIFVADTSNEISIYTIPVQ